MPTPPQSSPNNPLYQSFLQGAKGRPPIDKLHHYFDIYHRHFEAFRGRSPTVLEIGVQNGGSLHMWKDYFGEGARIYGIDVDPACAHRGPEGSKVFIGSQADPEFLRRVVAETGPLDIIIDDGGHTANQMIVSFETLYPHPVLGPVVDRRPAGAQLHAVRPRGDVRPLRLDGKAREPAASPDAARPADRAVAGAVALPHDLLGQLLRQHRGLRALEPA